MEQVSIHKSPRSLEHLGPRVISSAVAAAAAAVSALTRGRGKTHYSSSDSFLNDIQVCVCYSSFYNMDIRARTLRSDQTYRRLAPHDDDDYVVVTPPATSQQQPFWCT